jgi:hypothetical protein
MGQLPFMLTNATAAAVLMVAPLLGCERQHGGERLALEWKDADTDTIFRVTEAPSAVVKQNSRLHVEQGGRDHAVVIDDDAIFSTVAFVRYERWLLVVCRGVDEVWAGYDFEARRLYGESDWEKLPFTKWSGQGKVVAERRLHDTSASPANFPRLASG